MRARAWMVVAVAGALAPVAASPARAHLAPIGAVAPFVVDGALVGGSTSWGIVLVDDDSISRRVCEESAGPGAAIHMRVNGTEHDGRVLVGTGSGLLRTDDGGCTYSVVTSTSLAQMEITALAQGAGAVWVATGRLGLPNGVFKSTDGGETFEATALFGDASPLFTLVIDDASGRIVATGYDIDTEGPAVHESLDGGATWTRATFDVSPWILLRARGFDDNGHVLLAGQRADGQGDVILAPTGMATATTRGPLPGGATHAASLGDELYAVVAPGALYRSVAGAPFEPAHVDAECVFAVDGVLWVCGSTTGVLAGVHFAVRGGDDSTWDVILRDDEIEERICPEGTVGRTACERYLEPDPDPIDGGPGDPSDPDEPDAPGSERPRPAPTPADDTAPAGCAAAPSGAGVTLLALAGVARAGRRRRC